MIFFQEFLVRFCYAPQSQVAFFLPNYFWHLDYLELFFSPARAE